MHADAFRERFCGVVSYGWPDRVRVNWLTASAVLIAMRARSYDVRKSNAESNKWLNEGPRKCVSRHHKLLRVATGWDPSPVAEREPNADGDERASGDDDVDQDLLDGVEVCYSCLLPSQGEVDDGAA